MHKWSRSTFPADHIEQRMLVACGKSDCYKLISLACYSKDVADFNIREQDAPNINQIIQIARPTHDIIIRFSLIKINCAIH